MHYFNMKQFQDNTVTKNTITKLKHYVPFTKNIIIITGVQENKNYVPNIVFIFYFSFISLSLMFNPHISSILFSISPINVHFFK